jgi:hypothetical protein
VEEIWELELCREGLWMIDCETESDEIEIRETWTDSLEMMSGKTKLLFELEERS